MGSLSNMDNNPQQRYGDPKARPGSPVCKKCLFSTGLMKSGCPSCLVVGLAILPIEMAARGVKKIVVGPNGDMSNH
ncbi:MAG: hypothetical protein JKX70_02900 [Phycisphaerales bacterium]|nr:hypothetical protein [Phycisphaerales bacterium]